MNWRLSSLIVGILASVQVGEAQVTTTTTAPASTCVGPRTPTELQAQLLTNYDKLARPNVAWSLANGWSLTTPEPPQPDVARVQFHVLSLKNVDQKRNEYQLSAWYRRSWLDTRLAYTPASEGGCFPDSSVGIGFDVSMINDIWHPDFYIQNLAKKIDETAGAMWIEPDGTVFWSSQIEITLACQMVFDTFPYDEQKCGIQVSTYQQDASEIRMEFLPDRKPVTLASDTQTEGLPHGGTTEWSIVNSRGFVSNSNDGSIFTTSFLEVIFDIERNHEYYSDFVLVPAFMFVLIGWLSFFINRAAAPARVAMSMIGFLANMNFLSAQLGQLPRLGNNVWLLNFLYMSSFFSFYAILEYVLCNYLLRIEKRLEGARKKVRDTTKTTAEEDGGSGRTVTKQDLLDTGFDKKMDLLMINPRTTRMWFKDEHVEVFSRYVYPVAYIAVFLLMWYTK